MADRKNIKVSPELFERLNEERGHQPWNEFLEERVFGADNIDTATDDEVDIDAVQQELAALREQIDKLPHRTVEELEHHFR